MNYDDEKLVENFESIARAYNASLKNKGFVFFKLEESDNSRLLDEINIIFEKILAVLEILKKVIDVSVILNETLKNYANFREKFFLFKAYSLKINLKEENAFLSLFSLESLLTNKLVLLSTRSGEIEFCHKIITRRTQIYAESFEIERFMPKEY